MLKYKKKNKGSLTIEAAIVIPIFLLVYLLFLNIFKTLYISMVLDHAVKETAKVIATEQAYYINLINELEDDLRARPSLSGNIKTMVSSLSAEAVMKYADNEIFDENQKGVKDVLKGQVPSMLGQAFSYGIDWLTAFIAEKNKDNLIRLRYNYQREKTEEIFKQFIDNSIINKDKIRFTLIEYPKPFYTFRDIIETDKERYEKIGIKLEEGANPTEIAINNVDIKDDVIIQVAYDMDIILPFVGKKTITLTETAVEKGWISGLNGVYARKEEGFDLFKIAEDENKKNNDKKDDETKDKSIYTGATFSDIVYITRGGFLHYHSEDNELLYGHAIPIFKHELKDKNKLTNSLFNSIFKGKVKVNLLYSQKYKSLKKGIEKK